MQYDLHFQWPKRDGEIEREEIEKRKTDRPLLSLSSINYSFNCPSWGW